jgi:hypothetical protein
VNSLNSSIKRAQRLLKTPDDDENYISIKIKPANVGCCCFHCWPLTWREVNNEISQYGQLEDEGDVLLGKKGGKFVLECHESGPEIIIYLGVGIASANLIKSVLDIVLTIIRNRQREKIGAQFKITQRKVKSAEVFEENVLEIDIPLTKENITMLNEKIKDILIRDEY